MTEQEYTVRFYVDRRTYYKVVRRAVSAAEARSNALYDLVLGLLPMEEATGEDYVDWDIIAVDPTKPQ